MNDTTEFNSQLLAALAPHETTYTFAPGTVLFREGDDPIGVHVLLSGEVDLLFARRGDSLPVHFPVPGQILGLSSLVSGRQHEYAATAATTVLTGFVDRDTFFRVLHQTPARWFDVLQVLSSDIISCYDRVKELVDGNGGRRPAVRA